MNGSGDEAGKQRSPSLLSSSSNRHFHGSKVVYPSLGKWALVTVQPCCWKGCHFWNGRNGTLILAMLAVGETAFHCFTNSRDTVALLQIVGNLVFSVVTVLYMEMI